MNQRKSAHATFYSCDDFQFTETSNQLKGLALQHRRAESKNGYLKLPHSAVIELTLINTIQDI